jgi:hypothetical protein
MTGNKVARKFKSYLGYGSFVWDKVFAIFMYLIIPFLLQ